MNTAKPKTTLKHVSFLLTLALLVTSLIPASSAQAATQVVIYDNSLAANWQDWSWNTTRSFRNTSPVQSRSYSIAVTFTRGWAGLYLHHNGLSTSGYTHLQFAIHGDTNGGQKIQVIANSNTGKSYALTAPKNAWVTVSIPLSSLGSPASLTDLWVQDASGRAQAKFFLDDIILTGSGTAPTQPPAPTATRVSPTATSAAPTATRTSPTATAVVTQPTPLATATAQPPAATATPSTARFVTLPPGSALPSDAECAARVRKTPENKRSNATYNSTPGNQTLGSNFFDPYANDARANSVIAPRVTGNFTGTTDEILQWVACKWGIDEDMVRAQAAIESWWRQNTKGDWTTNAANCAPGHGLGVDGQPGQCPESFGILQNRYPYEKAAWPGIDNSTAFNADTGYAIWRACFEGYETWLNNVEQGKRYAAGDAWGCMGRWFSGRWYTQPANEYIARVQDYYNQRIWTTPGFQEP